MGELGDLGSALTGEKGTAGAGVSGRHNGEGGGLQPPRRRLLLPCFSPSWFARRRCLSHCLQKTPAQGRAGEGARSAAPCGFLAPDPSWVGAQASAATVGPDGGWAPRAGFDGGRGEGGVGEAVGGLTARKGFFALEQTPAVSPVLDFWVHQRNAAQPMMETGLQLGGSGNQGIL